MATYSSILARDIPWIEERSGLQSTGSQRVRHFLVIKSSSNNIYVRVHAKSLQSHQTLRRQRPWPARLLCPWDSLGKNTGVGFHFLLQGPSPTQGLNLHLMSPTVAGVFFTTSITWEVQRYFITLFF